MKYIASFIIIHIFFIKAMSFLANEKINFKNIKFYFYFLITLILLILNFEYSFPFLRVIFNIIIYIILAKFLFNKCIKDSIILGMVVTLLGICAEFIYVLFTYPIFNYNNVIEEQINVATINNFFIGIILIFICSLKKSKKLYTTILSATYKINEKRIAIFSLLIVIIFNFASLISYFVSKNLLDKYYLTSIGSFLCIFSSVLIFSYLKTESKYLTVYEKYNVSLDSIKEFEMMIENYRINTHENKNQLRTIRNMSKNKRIVSYIDVLLDENINDDERLLSLSQKIPTGGLRGIIYSKMLLMNKDSIPFELVVDKRITTNRMNKIDEYTLTSICKIIGVLLDNAIEYVKPFHEKYIIIELYEEEGELAISVTNNYEGYVDIDSINNPGISTKGKNHGYGLTLVQNLVNKNNRIQHTSEFFEDNFMQKIKIKV